MNDGRLGCAAAGNEEGSHSADLPSGAQVLLLFSVFAVAACGLVYELIAGAVSSYLLGDAVTQFSLVIGVFLCAMGLGSYFAKFVRRNLLRIFVEVEIWIGLLGGLSSMLLFAVFAFAPDVFGVVFYSLCGALGMLVGFEIPILVRVLRGGGGFSEAISNVLALDYLGALAGSILFPFVALPFLGLSRSSVVFGVINLAVAAAGMSLIRGAKRGMTVRLVTVAVVLVGSFFASARTIGFLEDLLYQDDVVYARDSSYQRIVITRWRDDVRLYLNGHIQFSSVDEFRYHEALVIPALEAAKPARSVLILGGGDGLAVREVLKYDSVEAITLVDIDPVVTELARTRPELTRLNEGALSSPKVTIVHQDAFTFLDRHQGFFDVIIADLPDPSTPALCKLYSRAMYSLMAHRLSLGGVLVTQATSPFFAPKAFWCIAHTQAEAVGEGERAALAPLPYHVHVPSFGEWGFVLAARREVMPELLQVTVRTRFLNTRTLNSMFVFPEDLAEVDTSVNTLENPVLYEYYNAGWRRYNE